MENNPFRFLHKICCLVLVASGSLLTIPPPVAVAHEEAGSAVCQDHLRQWHTAWVMYALDHDGIAAPPAPNVAMGSVGWMEALSPYVGFFSDVGSIAWFLNGHLDTPGSCPADQHEHGLASSGFGPENFLSYAYNRGAVPTFTRTRVVDVQPGLILFGDNRNNWHFSDRSTVGFRHGERANFVLADGSTYQARFDDPDDPPSSMWSNSATGPDATGDSAWIADFLVEPERIIAVGGSGSIFTRNAGDGSWQRQVHGDDSQHWNAIAQGNGHYVAVGARGMIRRSVDGKVWTPVSTGEPGSLNAVHFAFGEFWAAGEGLFWSGGDGALIWRSSDGEAWQKTTIPEASRLRSIASGEGQLVVVGMTGGPSTGSERVAIWSSADGESWTSRLTGAEGMLRDVAYGGGRFVAVGGGGLIYSSPDGLAWQRAEVPTMSAFHAVAYGNGRFLVTGGIGDWQEAFTSTDGLIWQPVRPPPGYGILRLAFDGERFAGAGAQRMLLSTPDGNEWKTEARGAPPPLWSVAATSELAVAAGASEDLLESSDAQTWEARLGATGRWWWDTAAAGEGMVSVGRFGAIQRRIDGAWEAARPRPPLADFVEFQVIGETALLVDRNRRLWRSTNGSDWEPAPSPWGGELRRLVVANGLAVAIGRQEVAVSADGFAWETLSWAEAPFLRDLMFTDGNWWGATSRGAVYRSPDLTAWSEVYLKADDPLHSIAHAGGFLYAAGWKMVSGTAHRYLLISADGVAWTRHDVAGEISELIGFGDRLLARRGNVVIASDDGLEWQEVLVAEGWPRLARHHAEERVLAADLKNLYSSTNGLDWQRVTAPTTLALKAAGSFKGSSYLAGRRGLLLRSPDGIDWELLSSGEEMRAVAHGAGRFVAVGENGAAFVSIDGETWAWRDTGATLLEEISEGDPVERRADLAAIAYGENLFVAVGEGGAVTHSGDGDEWIPVSPGLPVSARSLAFGNGLFIAVGDDGALFSSIDGLDWAPVDTPAATRWRGVEFSSGHWMAFGDEGAAARSDDGASWTPVSTGTGLPLNAVTTFGAAWIAVGMEGVIVTFAGEPVAPAGYDAWRAGLFSPGEIEDETVSGPSADPDGLGVPNLLRYAFGFRSRSWESGLLPEPGIGSFAFNDGEADFLFLSYVRPRDAADLAYLVEASADLVAWVPVETVTVEQFPLDEERDRVTLREADPLPPGAARRFLRVRVIVDANDVVP